MASTTHPKLLRILCGMSPLHVHPPLHPRTFPRSFPPTFRVEVAQLQSKSGNVANLHLRQLNQHISEAAWDGKTHRWWWRVQGPRVFLCGALTLVFPRLFRNSVSVVDLGTSARFGHFFFYGWQLGTWTESPHQGLNTSALSHCY